MNRDDFWIIGNRIAFWLVLALCIAAYKLGDGGMPSW